MNPRVSVLTPTYRHAAYIGPCIESVLAQTDPDWEMIIVDDGSPDGTADVAESYRDPRIKVIRMPNRGVEALGETYARALAESRGEFVAVLEGDDWWPESKLAVQLPLFRDDAALVTGTACQITDDGEVLGFTPAPGLDAADLRNEPVGRVAHLLLDPQILTFAFPVATMMRRSALEHAGGFRQPPWLPLVDYPTLLRLSLQGPWRMSSEVTGFWRRHPASITAGSFGLILDGAYREAAEFVRAHRAELPLTDAELDALELKWEGFQVGRLLGLARELNAAGERAAAKEALRRVKAFRRTRANRIATMLAETVGRGAEPLFRLSGRPTWKDIVFMPNGDRTIGREDLDRPAAVHRFTR